MTLLRFLLDNLTFFWLLLRNLFLFWLLLEILLLLWFLFERLTFFWFFLSTLTVFRFLLLRILKLFILIDDDISKSFECILLFISLLHPSECLIDLLLFLLNNFVPEIVQGRVRFLKFVLELTILEVLQVSSKLINRSRDFSSASWWGFAHAQFRFTVDVLIVSFTCSLFSSMYTIVTYGLLIRWSLDR